MFLFPHCMSLDDLSTPYNSSNLAFTIVVHCVELWNFKQEKFIPT